MPTPHRMPGRARTLRSLSLLLHRYVGLSIAVFLLLAGLTGSVLAFYEELDLALSPDLLALTPPKGTRMLEPFELRDRIAAALPSNQPYYHLELAPSPRRALSVWMQVKPGSWREAFADPYTGTLRGSRDWGNLKEGTRNLAPFLYQFHYSLNLGETGSTLFGIVALLWCIDCFVAAYLTFPLPRRQAARAGQVSWWRRFLRSFLLSTHSFFASIFSFHRAAGLWPFALLLVFAWSGVSLNLGSVYKPVMATVFGMEERLRQTLPRAQGAGLEPALTLRNALAKGRAHMADQAARRGFKVHKELALDYEPSLDAFVYRVDSNLDISNKYPRTEVYFDGRTGELLGFEAASRMRPGNTITQWLYALHFGAVGGFWYRVLVCLTGLVTGLLSVSGVWIWWRKRGVRRLRR